MIRTKSFRRASQIVSYFNKPENAQLTILGIIRENLDDIAVIYDEPEGAGTPEDQRVRVLTKRLNDHIGYPKTTKKKLAYPKSIIDFQVVPMARISNSLRNLRDFKGLGPAELTQWVTDNLPAGFKLLTRTQSSEEYGVDVTLIEKQVNVGRLAHADEKLTNQKEVP